MSDSDDDRSQMERLPDPLVDDLDALEPPELHAVHEYVEQRLKATKPPIEEKILEEATGEVLTIEDQGIYTLVRKRPPAQEGSDEDSQPVSLYHVRRERHPDGEETLHWSFLGNVHDQE